MAELIPLAYRMRVASRVRLERWVFWGVLTLGVCGALLASAYAWEMGTAGRLNALRSEYAARSTLITRSQELRGKRQDLAERMQKIQQLMDDRVLLALLRNVAGSFSSGNDCLEYIHIDARGVTAKSQGPAETNHFLVRITGITSNSTSLAELMSRLSKNGQPQVNVTLESSKREGFLDGQVMRFQILCERREGAGGKG